MEIREMNIEQIEERLAQISVEKDADGANLDALMDEVKEIEARKAEINAQIEQRNALANAIAKEETPVEVIKEFHEEERKTMTNVEVRNTADYIDAYSNYIKSGSDAECRALLTENVSGTIPVPTMVYDIVKTAWDKEGIMSLVKKAYIKGNLKVGFERSATDAVIHTEGSAAVAEEELVLGTVELVPQSIKKWISISDEAMDLRGEAFLQYIYDELAYRIAKKAADEIVAKIEANTATSTANSVAVPEVKASSITVGTIASALGLLSDEASNPVVMMNKASWSAFKAVQYANNYAVDPFEGLKVVFNNTIKSFADASADETYVIVGDLGHGALVNLPNGEGIEFKFDDKTSMTSDLVRVLGREYMGIGIVAPNAFVKIKK